jgi:hypothetical protein
MIQNLVEWDMRNLVESGNIDTAEFKILSPNFYGELSFLDPAIETRELIFTGIPEGAGFVADRAKLKFLPKPRVAQGQFFTGTTNVDFDSLSKNVALILQTLKNNLNGKPANIDAVAYSAGFITLSEVVKNNDFIDMFRSIIVVSPSIGGDSVPWYFGFMRSKYPTPEECMDNCSGLLNRGLVKGVLLGKKDKITNSKFTESVFVKNNIPVVWEERGHGIDGDYVNRLYS